MMDPNPKDLTNGGTETGYNMAIQPIEPPLVCNRSLRLRQSTTIMSNESHYKPLSKYL